MGQLAITGLSWCDVITDIEEDRADERICKDDVSITDTKEKLDLYVDTYLNAYLMCTKY